jgi:hypothetical protein
MPTPLSRTVDGTVVSRAAGSRCGAFVGVLGGIVEEIGETWARHRVRFQV